ncbi:hypothetical protein KUG85_17005 [Nitratireductor sp. L1-7-SE]|uniref:Outer membrane lipoprotein n=1 Tax=Nitratireductor rhodophyticola TaxID=2854036 RepID=A0ABS7R9W1_9HYPH|nr:hypothetical protein [Nitratireductor rhodophyticola]MBY8917703.1 hypothetical protein [Nitratireductor rhodophyticola]MBY8922414.1 hypothetical protein [Nitratireductor rhodophyticola]
MKTGKILTLATLVSALAVAGCQTGMPEPIVASAPAGVEGNWIGAEGLVSSFNNGAFQTKATDTGEVIATGSYTEKAGNLVEINVQSRVRAPQLVNCLKATYQGNAVVQLNCSSETGSQFVLRRG